MRHYKDYLKDIEESIEDIESYVSNITKGDLVKNKKTRDAVMMRLQIIGEASKNIPSSIKKANPKIPWKALQNVKNFIVYHHTLVGGGFFVFEHARENDIAKQYPLSKDSDLFSRHFREVITHSYYQTSNDHIWNVIKNQLPELKENLRKIKLL